MSSPANEHFVQTNAADPATDTDTFHLKDEPVENFRPLRVVVIGAGFSGIYMGIRISEKLRNIDLVMYDKNKELGGTWLENRYPGCACDIPAHSYVYSFEENPEWTSFYAAGKEIHGYLQKVSNKYSVGRFMKFRHKILGCHWDAEKLKWRIEVEKIDSQETFLDEADILISGRGALNDYKWPEIKGLRSFDGKLMHSAVWDESFDYSNKRIGVIGGGSSAIQIVPQLQKLPGTHLSCFIRSRTWISATFGASTMEKLGLEHDQFTNADHDKYTSNAERYHAFRKMIEDDGNAMHPFTLKGSAASNYARDSFTRLMRTRLAKKPEIADVLIPNFAPGCRRLTPGEGFLEALTEDNVDFISAEINAVTPSGVILEGGKEIELDVLVCATGFNAVGAPVFPIVGFDGQTLSGRFNPYPEAYMSLAIDGFPNFFSLLGPNGGAASGTLLRMVESVGDYIVKCIRKIQKEDIGAMHVSRRAMRSWTAHIDAYFKKTVFMDECKTWYRKGDRIIGLWPGSNLHALETLRSPRWEDYEYLYHAGDKTDEKLLRWLGNGWSELQLNGGDTSYYIEPGYVDIPSSPFPEETEMYNKLSFSH